MRKAELLTGLHDEQRLWESLLMEIGEARMDQPGVTGQWSIKDIVAHLTGWRRRTVERLEAAPSCDWAITASLPTPWPAQLQTDDAINAWIYEANRDRAVGDVLADSRQIFRRLIAAIEALSEADIMDPNRYPWHKGEPLSAAALFAHFHEEHEPAMRAWLAQQLKAHES